MKVKVILKKQVSDLGAKGSVHQVKMGYAKNYLLPQGLAELATEAKMEERRKKKQAVEDQKKQAREKAEELAESLEGVKLDIRRKLTKTGKIFGSIKAKDIRSRLEKKDIELEEDQIKLEAPLEETGVHKVPVDLGFDHEVEIKVKISEKEED